jgi:hypothetical protein
MNMRRSLVSTLSIAAVAVSGLVAAHPALARGGGPTLPMPRPPLVFVGSDLGVTGIQYGIHFKPGPSTCNSDGTVCSGGGDVPDYGYLDVSVKNEGIGETAGLDYFRAVATVDGYEDGCAVFSAHIPGGASTTNRLRLDQRPHAGTHSVTIQLWQAYGPTDCADFADGSLLFNQQLDQDPYNDHMTVTIKPGGLV